MDASTWLWSAEKWKTCRYFTRKGGSGSLQPHVPNNPYGNSFKSWPAWKTNSLFEWRAGSPEIFLRFDDDDYSPVIHNIQELVVIVDISTPTGYVRVLVAIRMELGAFIWACKVLRRGEEEEICWFSY
jgi:hypothetical protein